MSNNNYQEELIKSLESGFIDRFRESNAIYAPQIITNNATANKKVLSSIQNELRNCDEFWFNVAFVTSGGVATIINELQLLKKLGKRGKILVSQYQNFTQPEALRRLLQFTNIELKIVTDKNMHSKGYLFRNGDVYNYIVGSSNLTDNAFKVNQELNIKISATQESNIIFNTLIDFENQFNSATAVDEKFIDTYNSIYQNQISNRIENSKSKLFGSEIILPNRMQIEALKNLEKIRNEGKPRALIISATGTGKTYLSAFDVKKVKPKKFLFIVHRRTIAEKSLESFKNIIGNDISMGMYSGADKETECDYLFSTIQTISKDSELRKFNPREFDYIVIDETHRAGAESYKKIMNYFKPQFLLGMTATPERTDGFDIYSAFDHTIAYEIRLHKALEENMLSPFHYYGITDLEINNETIDEHSDFNKLTSKERIKHILKYIKFYGCDNGEVRGLIFCSRTEEAKKLSVLLNLEGLRTIALSGENSEEERKNAIRRLELKSSSEKIDYIISVDIFNEGVDIPKVNQVIMLRPTQSAIIFVQQLGRGLRKTEGKDYLTVIDFIGNYSNNFLVPIALFGDNTFNKDNIRKLITTGSDIIPGASTISFDEISKKRIFEAIDTANLKRSSDLKNDYSNLEYKIGRTPMMMDFVEHGSRDPQHYIDYSKSLYNFSRSLNKTEIVNLNSKQIQLLEFYSKEIANGKRVTELIILESLLISGVTSKIQTSENLKLKYNIELENEEYLSAINVLNFEFINKYESLVVANTTEAILSKNFKDLLNDQTFKDYLLDIIKFGIFLFEKNYDELKFRNGFVLYKKYSRKDVCRILNWERDEHSTVYGYKIKYNTAPLFVNYHKEDHIASQTKFDDRFIDNHTFQWFTKPRRYLHSNEVIQLKDSIKNNLRILLFIKKHNGEGDDFYYMGDVTPIENQFEQTSMKNDKGENVSVVKILYKMNDKVEDGIYNYLSEK